LWNGCSGRDKAIVGTLGIAFAFGLALIGAAYGIGPISVATSIQP